MNGRLRVSRLALIAALLLAGCANDESPDVTDDLGAADTADTGGGTPDSATDGDTIDSGVLDANDLDADVADTEDDVPDEPDIERIACTSVGAECAEDERCVHSGFGYCGEYEGVCVATPAECPPNTTDWRACPCEGLPSTDLCTYRQVSGRRAGLCIEREGTSCNPSSAIGCEAGQVCIPKACEGGTCGGVCLAVTDACLDAPSGEVCAGELWLTGDPLEPIGECWPSACDAWNAGHRGFLIFAP